MLIAQQSFFSNIDEISKQGAITKFLKNLSALSTYIKIKANAKYKSYQIL